MGEDRERSQLADRAPVIELVKYIRVYVFVNGVIIGQRLQKIVRLDGLELDAPTDAASKHRVHLNPFPRAVAADQYKCQISLRMIDEVAQVLRAVPVEVLRFVDDYNVRILKQLDALGLHLVPRA